MAGAALAYDFPSTNDDNRLANPPQPHVNMLEVGIGEVSLRFVNDTNSYAYFEYRIDGQALTSGTAHPVTGDFINPGVGVDGRGVPTPVTVDETFFATEKVEVRLALGGERDWDFDWTEFLVGADASDKMDCMKGGWEEYGFDNQGQCVRFLTSGKNSR